MSGMALVDHVANPTIFSRARARLERLAWNELFDRFR
jgi:hypothetical protein